MAGGWLVQSQGRVAGAVGAWPAAWRLWEVMFNVFESLLGHEACWGGVGVCGTGVSICLSCRYSGGRGTRRPRAVLAGWASRRQQRAVFRGHF